MKKKHAMGNREKTFLAITIPIVLLFFCFNTLPLIKGFIYSFTNFKGYGNYDFVGLRNYVDLFSDGRVGRSYLFTFKFALVSTILVNVLSLILAMGLNSKIKSEKRPESSLFPSKHPGRSGCRLYFQFLFHLHPAGCRKGCGDRMAFQQYALQHKDRLACHRSSRLLAVCGYEYHHLHCRTADSAGGCL